MKSGPESRTRPRSHTHQNPATTGKRKPPVAPDALEAAGSHLLHLASCLLPRRHIRLCTITFPFTKPRRASGSSANSADLRVAPPLPQICASETSCRNVEKACLNLAHALARACLLLPHFLSKYLTTLRIFSPTPSTSTYVLKPLQLSQTLQRLTRDFYSHHKGQHAYS